MAWRTTAGSNKEGAIKVMADSEGKFRNFQIQLSEILKYFQIIFSQICIHNGKHYGRIHCKVKWWISLRSSTDIWSCQRLWSCFETWSSSNVLSIIILNPSLIMPAIDFIVISPRARVNQEILALKDEGEIEDIYNKWWSSSDSLTQQQQTKGKFSNKPNLPVAFSASKVSFKEVTPVYFIALLGLASGLLLSLWEANQQQQQQQIPPK
jgi:hypothetical protein